MYSGENKKATSDARPDIAQERFLSISPLPFYTKSGGMTSGSATKMPENPKTLTSF
jgi:hypothetical protein